MQVIQPVSQSDIAYEALREGVRRRQILPGYLLSEGRLAQQLGMSRTPVREAITRLVHEGLLEVLPKRGVMVRTLTAKDIEELYTVREHLETLAARLAAPRITKDGLASLRQTLQEAGAELEGAGNFERLSTLDMDFHSEIWRQSGNGRLEGLLRNLGHAAVLDPWRVYITALPDAFKRSVSQHTRILEALEARDAQGAEDAMRQHARSYWKSLLEFVFGGKERVEGALATI
jgi:DNA-binding GntR family transcriptional regulator